MINSYHPRTPVSMLKLGLVQIQSMFNVISQHWPVGVVGEGMLILHVKIEVSQIILSQIVWAQWIYITHFYEMRIFLKRVQICQPFWVDAFLNSLHNYCLKVTLWKKMTKKKEGKKDKERKRKRKEKEKEQKAIK